MAVGDARIQAVGRLGDDPTLRFTPSGAGVASVSLAVQGRVKNGDRWEDGDTTWYRVTVWREYAENVAESLRKGDRVVVVGTVSERKYQKDTGEEGRSLEIQAESITPDLRFAQVDVRRIERSGGGGGYAQGGGGADQWNGGGGGRQQGGQYGGRPQGGGGRGAAHPDDPWGQPPQGGGGYGQQQGFAQEPPF